MVGAIGIVAFAVVAGAIGFMLGGIGDEAPVDGEVANQGADAPVPPNEPGSDVAQVGGIEKEAPPPAAPPPPPPPCAEGMAQIEGGKFFMGTDRDAAVLGPARPAHQVEVGPYCIDLHEVTVDQYRECSLAGECKRAFRKSEWPGSEDSESWNKLCNENYDDRGTHPINCVTWQQADAYCQWRDARLPSEAEWELAARGSDGRVFPWGDDPPTAEHMNGCGEECQQWRVAEGLDQLSALLYPTSDGFPATAPVGSFAKGRTHWGLDDIAGNVFEWTGDAYLPYPGSDAKPHDDGIPRRVIRGGAFNSFLADHADPALRFPQAESAHTHGIGFRCASAIRG